ncbi:MAG TPA: LD-carboxypeptidase, partial [Burkholderiaceae bacterium]|nr:LD-carboxypeptidase [Burkholderiaceae bacterium]
HAALESPARLVLAVRGGYGLTRLLDAIDWQALGRAARSGRKLFIGHSDFTVFHLALLAKGKAVSFAGPMAAYDFGGKTVSAFTERHFWGLLGAHEYGVTVRAARQPRVAVEGTLWGGNLAMVASLVGTPWWPKVRDGVLFLEDVNEHPYRVERMLYQLHHAGILAQQRAVLLGDFSGYQLAANDNGYDFDRMVAHARGRFGVPILTGLPFGHCPDKLTLPVGGHVVLESMRGGYRLEMSRYPTLAA